MLVTTTHLRCDMKDDCHEQVTMLDNKGFVYCAKHGMERRWSYIPCRKLRPYELARLQRGEALNRY